MAIKKVFATKDTTITDAYRNNGTRATNANMGAADSLEIFSVYGYANPTSVERSRILVQFDIVSLNILRNQSKIPASGSTKFYLNMYNVAHSTTVPTDFTVSIDPLSSSWDEGYGFDMESYGDKGGISQFGATWDDKDSSFSWNTTGSDIVSGYNYTASFTTGLEDISVDITSLVENWMTGSLPNYGLLLKLSGSFEDGTTTNSFYTKKFSARTSEFFYKRPSIVAVWDDSIKDNRNEFFYSASYLSTENIQNLYYYNITNGSLKDLPALPTVTISDSSSSLVTGSATISKEATGIYKASFALSGGQTTDTTLNDKWYYSGSLVRSQTFKVKERTGEELPTDYLLSITNLKNIYKQGEVQNIKIYSRPKNWSPNIYTVSVSKPESKSIKNLHFKLVRTDDNQPIIDYATGSVQYTLTSYNGDGNNFTFDFSYLQADYSYYFQFATYDGTELKEYPQKFKFRVE